MSTIETAPYFHPTQIVLIDDDINFLGNLSLQLDADLAYLLFDSTQKALAYLNRRQSSTIVRDRFFRETQPSRGKNGTAEDSRNLLEIDIEAISQEMHSSDRFSQISVVLVDYAMPQMDGLQFCESITDPHVKKILFTGVATESLAVDAFNEGLIDQYIRKHEHAVYDRLNRAIRQFQRDYILDLFVAAADVLPLAVPDMLADPGIAGLIEELRKQSDLVEYYIACDPDGFFFATSEGKLKRVVTRTKRDLAMLGARLDKTDMPKDLTRRVTAAELIPNPHLDKPPTATSVEQYRTDVAEAMPMPNGAHELKWALFDVTINDQPARLKPSYTEFLEWLDTVGYSMM